MPLKTARTFVNHENDLLLDLRTLFSDEGDQGEFLGFDMPHSVSVIDSLSELNVIFATTSDEEEFFGFTDTSQNLATIFHNESNESEFFGFWKVGQFSGLCLKESA